MRGTTNYPITSALLEMFERLQDRAVKALNSIAAEPQPKPVRRRKPAQQAAPMPKKPAKRKPRRKAPAKMIASGQCPPASATARPSITLH